MSVDYYAVLGIERNASEDDIRRAYKKIAMKDHPDRNPGDKMAEERFKQANEAYSVLSDPQKRAQYDSPSRQSGFGGFSGFDDMFAEIFGVRHRPQQSGPRKGSDIRIEVELSLRDSMLGCKQELTLNMPERCQPCGGNGSKNGTSLKKCQTCGGNGQIREVMGAMMFQQTCSHCGGKGQVVDVGCVACNGTGQNVKPKKITVIFPAGIDAGNNLKIAGQGHSSPDGGPAGDLYVLVHIRQEQKFKRAKNDLLTTLELSISEAILGTKKKIMLPDDQEIEVAIAPGSQPGHVVTVNNAGVVNLKSDKIRGNLFVELHINIPRYISEHAAELIKQFEEEVSK